LSVAAVQDTLICVALAALAVIVPGAVGACVSVACTVITPDPPEVVIAAPPAVVARMLVNGIGELAPPVAAAVSVTCTLATTPFGITAGVSPYRMQRTDPDAGTHESVFAAAAAAGPAVTVRLETSAVEKPSVHWSPAGPFVAVEFNVRPSVTAEPGAALPLVRLSDTCPCARPAAENTNTAAENIQRRARA
jgi:hypothetical protein